MGMYDHWKIKTVVFCVFILPRILVLYVLPILVLSVLGGLLFAHFYAPFVWGLNHSTEVHP